MKGRKKNARHTSNYQKATIQRSRATCVDCNSHKVYDEVIVAFEGGVHQEAVNDSYDFVQVFGTTNEDLQSLAQSAEKNLKEDGLFWLCYPKKSSKVYKDSDCSRESVSTLLSEEGYEPVRQIAIDVDWSFFTVSEGREYKDNETNICRNRKRKTTY